MASGTVKCLPCTSSGDTSSDHTLDVCVNPNVKSSIQTKDRKCLSIICWHPSLSHSLSPLHSIILTLLLINSSHYREYGNPSDSLEIRSIGVKIGLKDADVLLIFPSFVFLSLLIKFKLQIRFFCCFLCLK